MIPSQREQIIAQVTPERVAAIVRDLYKQNKATPGGLNAYHVLEALLIPMGLSAAERAQMDFHLKPAVIAAITQIRNMHYQEGDS